MWLWSAHNSFPEPSDRLWLHHCSFLGAPRDLQVCRTGRISTLSRLWGNSIDKVVWYPIALRTEEQHWKPQNYLANFMNKSVSWIATLRDWIVLVSHQLQLRSCVHTLRVGLQYHLCLWGVWVANTIDIFGSKFKSATRILWSCFYYILEANLKK